MSDKPLYLQALDSLRKREWLLRILIFTLVTIVFWIGFNIYVSQNESKVPIDIRKHTEPLNPNINRNVLDELGQRQRYLDEDLQQFPLYEITVDEDGAASLRQVGTGAVISVGGGEATPEAETQPATQPAETQAPGATESAGQSGTDSATPAL